jgi:hypothetical protein
MAIHPSPGECIYEGNNKSWYAGRNEWRFFLSYQDDQYHTVDVSRLGRDRYAYCWRVGSTLQTSGPNIISPGQVPGPSTKPHLVYSSAPPVTTRDEKGVTTTDIEQLASRHLRPDVSAYFWTDDSGGTKFISDTHILWDEPHLDSSGKKTMRYHREGYPAIIGGTNLIKLADLTVSECGPAPSKDGTPVYVSSVGYHLHGLEHRDDGPYYTKSVCTCSTGRCERLRVWRQHGELRTDRPYRVTCDRQVWVPRDYRPATVHRDGRLDWPVSAPERYTVWVHAGYAQPVRLRFRAIAAASTVAGLSNLITWWVDE